MDIFGLSFRYFKLNMVFLYPPGFLVNSGVILSGFDIRQCMNELQKEYCMKIELIALD